MILCPHCEAKLEPPAEVIGKDIICPHCTREFHYAEKWSAKWLRAVAMVVLAAATIGLLCVMHAATTYDEKIPEYAPYAPYLATIVLCLIFFLLDTRLPKRPA